MFVLTTGNLPLDHSFESGDLAAVQTNWLLGIPAEFSVDVGRLDRKSLKVTTTRTSVGWNSATPITMPESQTVGVTPNLIPVTPGQVFAMSIWSKQTAGARATHYKVTWFDAGGSGLGNFQPMAGQDGLKQWTRYSGSWTVPAGAFYARVDVMFGYWDGVTGPNAQIWFDDVQFGSTDQSSKVMTLNVKLQTLDVKLRNPTVRPAKGDRVTLDDPPWIGTVVGVKTADPVARIVNYAIVSITAVNEDEQLARPGPFDLSDVAASDYDLRLENGTGDILLEDGTGGVAVELLAYRYSRLVLDEKDNQDGTSSVNGSCRINQAGLRPGDTLRITSGNQGLNAREFGLTNVSVSWPTRDHPVYDLDFGDPIVTMSVWVRGEATDEILPITETRISDSAVTTPKIAANAVTAEQIAAGSITADKLTAVLILASMIKAGTGPAHMEMDATGLRAYNAAGDIVVNIPDDGSPVQINADLIGQTLTVLGNAILRGTLSELALGAVLRIDSAQEDPAQPPALAAGWADSTDLDIDASVDISASAYVRVGLEYDPAGGAGGATASFLQATNKNDGSDEWLLELDAVSMAVNRKLDLSTLTDPGNVVHPLSVCRVGTHIYLLSKDVAPGSGGSGSSGANGAQASFDFSGANTDDQIAHKFTMPSEAGVLSYTINSVTVNCGSHSGTVSAYGCVWNSSGTLLERSNASSIGTPNADHTFNLRTPLVVAPGTVLYVGFARTSAGSGQWGVQASGNFYIDQQAGAPTNASFSAATAPYVLGTMKKALVNYTKNTSVTTWTIWQFDQATLALQQQFVLGAMTYPIATPVSPVMASDGTYLYIADKPTGTGTIKFSKYDGSNPYINLSGVIDTGYSSGSGDVVSGAAAGSFDLGAARLALCTVNGVEMFDATGVRQVNETFPVNGARAYGLAFGDPIGDGPRFWSLPLTAALVKLTKHSTWTWTTASAKYWVGFSWFDSVNLYETRISPRASITMGRRQTLTVTNGALPSSADTIRTFMTNGAADPGAGQMPWIADRSVPTLTLYLPTVQLQVSREDALGELLLEDGVSYLLTDTGFGDRTTNNFPSGNPAEIASQTGGISLKGDGTARFGSGLYAGPYRFLASSSASQSCTDNTWTTLNVNTEVYDDGAGFDTVTHLFTAPVSGDYLLVGRVLGSPATRLGSRFLINGVNVPGQTLQGGGVTSGEVNAITVWRLTAGDTVAHQGFQQSGGALVLQSMEFSARLLSKL